VKALSLNRLTLTKAVRANDHIQLAVTVAGDAMSSRYDLVGGNQGA